MNKVLFDQNEFYGQFIKDVSNCQSKLVIESPFISSKRLAAVLPILTKLVQRGVKVIVNTRHPSEHFDYDSQHFIEKLQRVGVEVLYTGGLHRKLAIIDDTILWEGSLNILSQTESCEMMRRHFDCNAVQQMLSFVKISDYLG